MKNLLKKAIGRIPLLDRIQHTNFYRSLRNRSFRDHIRKQRLFYRNILGADNRLIFDIGANVGDHTHIFAKLSDKVVSVEPDNTNAHILKKRFSERKVVVLQKAVSDTPGIAELHIETNGSAYNTLSDKWVNILEDKDLTRYDHPTKFSDKVEVETVTLDSLIREHGRPDFIKIDVEGFELKVVKGLTTPVPNISIECNLPEFLEETLNIVSYLRNLDSRYVFNYGNEHQFYLDKYVSADKMLELLRNTEYRFLEIYVHLNTGNAQV